MAWAWEMAAWFALVEGRYPDVVAACEAGLRHAGVSNAAAQLTVQAARGHARMGNERAARAAIEAGSALVEQLPAAEHPEHHFVFDGDKAAFYGAFIYTWLDTPAADRTAEEYALEVVRQCGGYEVGAVRWPSRLGIIRILQGTLAGRRRELEEALHHGVAGLTMGRNPAGLLDRAADLHHELVERFPGEPGVREYGALVATRRAELRPLARGADIPAMEKN